MDRRRGLRDDRDAAAVRHLKAEEQLPFFDAVERRFASQARLTTVLAGLTGLYLLVRLDLWDRFLAAGFWWMHAMVLVWLLFTLLLFVAEPLFLHRSISARAKRAPATTYRAVEWLHRILLALSTVTVFGAVAGSHGLLFE